MKDLKRLLGIATTTLTFPFSLGLGLITLLEGGVIILSLGYIIPSWSLLYALWLLDLSEKGWRTHKISTLVKKI